MIFSKYLLIPLVVYLSVMSVNVGKGIFVGGLILNKNIKKKKEKKIIYELKK